MTMRKYYFFDHVDIYFFKIRVILTVQVQKSGLTDNGEQHFRNPVSKNKTLYTICWV